MKTRKIIIGTMAVAMLSLSVCSLIPAAAAGETVQITAGTATVKAGEQFEVEVTLSDIPATGAQACNFSIEFDKSIITIDEIKAGALTQTGAGTSDPSATMLPNLNVYLGNSEGFASVMWSTSLDDASYWLKGEGVLCTVKGTVAADAKAGAKSELKIAPVKRMTTTDSGVVNKEIDCGYLKDGERVAYTVSTTSGSVTVAGATAPTQAPTQGPTTSGKGLRGDANCDGKVTIADSTAILQSLGNPDKYGLSTQGAANADVADPAGVTTEDALRIQMLDAGLITEAEL